MSSKQNAASAYHIAGAAQGLGYQTPPQGVLDRFGRYLIDHIDPSGEPVCPTIEEYRQAARRGACPTLSALRMECSGARLSDRQLLEACFEKVQPLLPELKKLREKEIRQHEGRIRKGFS